MDKSALIATPDTGIRLNLSNYLRIRTWQGGGEFWEHHNQQLIRDTLGQFLPRATVESGGTVLYQHFEGGKELCSQSEPVTAKNPIPHDQAEQLRAALTLFKAKASDPTCDPDSRKLIECFRLPDPKKDPELYRVIGSGRRRRLIVLWGAEKEQDSAISPLEAVNMVHAEPPAKSGALFPLGVIILTLLLGGAAIYHYKGGFADKSSSPSSENIVTHGSDGRLVLVSPSNRSSESPAGIGSVEKPDGSSFRGPNGIPLVLSGVSDADGKPVQAGNGEPLKVGLVAGADGKPDPKNDTESFVMSPVTGADGKPVLGQDGEPVMVGLVSGSASDKSVDGKRLVMGADNTPVKGPDGEPVEAGLLTDADGKPVLGSDGKQKAVGLISGPDQKPIAVGPVTDPRGKPLASSDNKPIAIQLKNDPPKAKTDGSAVSTSTVVKSVPEAKPGEVEPTKPLKDNTPSEGGKLDSEMVKSNSEREISVNNLPMVSSSMKSTNTVETKADSPTPGVLSFGVEEVSDKGQQEGKVAVKLLPIFGGPIENVSNATWKIDGAPPKASALIEEVNGSMTLWLAPGSYRIELKTKSISGSELSAEAELQVQVKTRVELLTSPRSGNR